MATRRKGAVQISEKDLMPIVQGYLKEFEHDARTALEQAIWSTAGKITKMLNKAGTFGGTGEYKSNWRWERDYHNLWVTAHVYNLKTYRLTHLLEFGHARRGGGRNTTDYPHIGPVNDKVPEIFQDEFIDALDRLIDLDKVQIPHV